MLLKETVRTKNSISTKLKGELSGRLATSIWITSMLISLLRNWQSESIKVRKNLLILTFNLLIGVKTDDLDNLAAETCAYMTIIHPGYSKLASNIAISNLHKRTTDDFLEVATRLYTKIKDKVGRPAPLLADDVYAVIQKNAQKIQEHLDFSRDFNYDYFGFKTLERSYLMKDGK